MEEVVKELSKLITHASVEVTRAERDLEEERCDDSHECENTIGYWNGVIETAKRAIVLIYKQND